MYDLIIIGAGPAGLTAGLYAGRYRLNTLILEKTAVGGQIVMSHEIENYPGFPQPLSTQELIDRLRKHVEDLNIDIIEVEGAKEISQITKPGGSGIIFNIKTENNSYEARCVIIATGAQPRMLKVTGEERLIGRGVSYCGTCDGPLFKDKDIVVVGGGDRALEEAIFLSGYAKKVTVIHRREELRASKIFEEKALNNPKIDFLLNTIIEEIEGDQKVEALKIKDVKTDSVGRFPCQGVFIFVGIKPNTGFLNHQLTLDDSGYIITDQLLATSQEGIFACGDCRQKSLYQVITACADGAVAASSVQRYLL
ncbi:MAG: thioredoxin-disulfide reductase [Candidatus Omnitrophota bacterium]